MSVCPFGQEPTTRCAPSLPTTGLVIHDFHRKHLCWVQTLTHMAGDHSHASGESQDSAIRQQWPPSIVDGEAAFLEPIDGAQMPRMPRDPLGCPACRARLERVVDPQHVVGRVAPTTTWSASRWSAIAARPATRGPAAVLRTPMLSEWSTHHPHHDPVQRRLVPFREGWPRSSSRVASAGRLPRPPAATTERVSRRAAGPRANASRGSPRRSRSGSPRRSSSRARRVGSGPSPSPSARGAAPCRGSSRHRRSSRCRRRRHPRRTRRTTRCGRSSSPASDGATRPWTRRRARGTRCRSSPLADPRQKLAGCIRQGHIDVDPQRGEDAAISARSVSMPEAGQGRHDTAPAIDGATAAPSVAAVHQVGLVEGHEARLVAGPELVEHGLDRPPVLLRVRRRRR